VFISGNIVSKKDVAETIQRFNIQVNNLTQVSFLPAIRIVHAILILRVVFYNFCFCNSPKHLQLVTVIQLR